MIVVMKFGTHEMIFELTEDMPNAVCLKCNNFNILTVTSEGLIRHKAVNVPGIAVDSEGRIEQRSPDSDDHIFKTQGKSDVKLKIIQNSLQLYCQAITKNSEECLFTVDSEGLYLWMASEHAKNCYKSSKTKRILLVE